MQNPWVNDGDKRINRLSTVISRFGTGGSPKSALIKLAYNEIVLTIAYKQNGEKKTVYLETNIQPTNYCNNQYLLICFGENEKWT
jgi:hypothetical protein